MRFNIFIAVLLCVVGGTPVSAYPPTYSNEPPVVNDSGGNDDDGVGYANPKFSFTSVHLHHQQHLPDSKPMATLKTSTLQSEAEKAISATTTMSTPALQLAYVYSAPVPLQNQPEANKVVNAVKLASSIAAAMSDSSLPSIQSDSTGPNDSSDLYGDSSKKTIGSSAPSSIAVVLNGNEPEFTDALGQKVPKPLPSLQVASPIDLLNPDRYEFFTFDENGDLVKRLMTMEEVQSIVANGDGEGPTIIHHSQVEDHDPEKNVQDIVTSVQNVLNKEVQSNKNSSTNIFPVLDTPDVSSSWSMILPAIFGNTGGVDILTQQKPHQIVMTPDTEIIETSTKAQRKSTTKKTKPVKRKPVTKQEAAVTTSTKDVTPQVIQEELESHESVYTGMLQYQNLAATMQGYEDFTHMHMQPIYHKLPEQIETTTKQVAPMIEENILSESHSKKPVHVQTKPLLPHRVKLPNGGSTSTKQPLSTKQKIKRKPATPTISKPQTTATTETVPSPETNTTSTTTQPPAISTEAVITTIAAETKPSLNSPTPTDETQESTIVIRPISTMSKKKKKKPTRQPVPSSTAQSENNFSHIHLVPNHRKPSPTHPHRPRPTHTTNDQTAEGTTYQDMSQNNFQHVAYHRPRPKPQRPTKVPVHSTTVVIAPVPTATVPTVQEPSLIVEPFPGYMLSSSDVWTQVSTQKPKVPSTTQNLFSSSVTSGYPVPAFALKEEKTKEHAGNQNIKHTLPNAAILKHTTFKPYPEKDIHAMQSFDQILQSLKQADNEGDKPFQQFNTSVQSPIHLVSYNSAENFDELEEMASKHMVPIENTMLETQTTNLTHIGNDKIPTTQEVLDATTDLSLIVAGETTTESHPTTQFISTQKSDIEIATITSDEETTGAGNKYILEGNISEIPSTKSEEIESSTQSSGEYRVTAITNETIQAPVTSIDSILTTEQITAGNTVTEIPKEESKLILNKETTTNVNAVLEDTTHEIQTRLPVSLPHNKDTTLDDDRDNYNQPILVADLKAQLNMEVLKPSEQISMSDFQTQAATVASTLVDGTNTLTAEGDYNLVNSNHTKDEIAFLLSDVIKQISSDHEAIQNTKQINVDGVQLIRQPPQLNYNENESPEVLTSNIGGMTFNDNRFSNFAKLNTSFLTIPLNNYNKSLNGNDEGLDSIATDAPNIFDDETISSDTDASEEPSTELSKPYILQHNLELFAQSSAIENMITTTIRAEDDLSVYEETTESTKNLESETKSYITDIKKEGESEITNVSFQELYGEKIVFTEDLIGSNESTTTVENLISPHFDDIKLDKVENAPHFENNSIFETTTHESRLDEEQSNYSENTIPSTVEYTFENEPTTTEINIETTTDMSVVTNKEENTSFFSTESSEDVNSKEHVLKTTTLKEDLTETDSSKEGTSIHYENSTDNSSERYPEDSNSNATNFESQHITENSPVVGLKDSSNDNMISEIVETNTVGNKFQLQEETTTVQYNVMENFETTTLSYAISEETSEEHETVDLADEDPYIKLGETTTTSKLIESTTLIPSENIQQITEQTLDSPKPISSVDEPEFVTEAESTSKHKKFENTSDVADEEDEDDQFGYHSPKLEKPTSVSSISTTTTKPTVSTTRRLNTLKPVSYFNKQPAFAYYTDTVEPLYNKPILGLSQHENVPNKVMIFSIPTPQQRPMHRPPQLNNLMISSNQATRPPVKLEPSPVHSKGLEASLANLDEDIIGFAKLCNELAFSYWKSITSEKISSTRSFVLSPFALTSMLSMVFLGARGSTSGEMNDVLKLDDMVTFNPHLVFKNITDSVERSTDSDIATTAFVREVFSDRSNGKVLQFFKEKTHQFYLGHVEEVNFHVVNDIIRRRTNLLVKRHTMGKVLEYLRTNSVWVNGPLATISANLFQTDCSLGSTIERDGEIFFQVHPTVRQRRLVPIPAVLFKTGFTAGYEPNLGATVVAFGRIQDATSMIYVMPGHHSSLSPSDNLDRLEKELIDTAITKNAWSNLLTSLMDRPGMEVQLPRFSHRSFVNATLGLQKMGLKGLFKSDFADLGGLTGSSNRDIFLSDIIQINTFSTCGEEKIADHHHVEMYPAPPLRKRNKDVEAHQEEDFDSSEAVIDFGSLVQDSAIGRGFYDDLLDPKYLELPLPLRPRQARVPDTPRLRFDKPFLYFVRHNPTGMILFMGRFNPRLLP